ncbi:hypothetical protein H6F89_09395 [Cyanobacteria bacterium FACHB-63]|nr:hypothetical protein [Cyanobacteria bacterium FACHB-63]
MTVLPLAALAISGQAASADTLLTRDFQIFVNAECAEGNVTCNNVNYVGTNLHTGATLQLKGRTLHTTCADGVTPCRFLGYEFRNGDYSYTVTEAGRLIVRKGERTLLNQAGTWERDEMGTGQHD